MLLVAAFLRLARINEIPPGPFYDDAANGLIAQGIAYGGERPIFTLAFTGREPLYHYVTAGLMRLIGDDLLALRMASFYLGMIVVAGVLALARAFFRGERHARWLALVAGSLAATTFWPVSNARFGMRAISFTFTITLLLWGLIRLWQRRRLSDAVWAGFWAGATAYTYTANRIVPLALGLIWVWMLARREGRSPGRPFAVFGLTALVLFAPMGAFLIRHPEVITHRATQVAAIQPDMPPPEASVTVLRGVIAALGAFGFRGDPLLYLNVPGRPVFDPVVAAAFYAGLVVTLARVIRSPERRVLSGLILIWFGVMLLPGALTIEPFHSLRSLGVLPVAMLLPAVGLGAGLSLIERRYPIPQVALAAIWGIVLLGTAAETYDAYFRRWGRDPVLYSLRDGDMADLGRWFNAHDTGEASIYILSFHYEHPTMAFIAEDYGRMKWTALGRTVVYPPPEREAYIGVPQSGLVDPEWLYGLLAPAELLAGPTLPDGKPRYLVYRVGPETPRPQPEHPLEINFANTIRLIGYDEGPEHAGEVTVTLYWEVLSRPEVLDYGPVAHLVDAWGFEWARAGLFNYPPEEWEPGELIIHQMPVERPPGLPPGEYTLELEWFSPATDGRLPVIREGQFGGVYGMVGPVRVGRAATGSEPPIQFRLERAMGPLRLLGYDLESTERYAGDLLRLALHWQAGEQPERDLRVRLELEGSGGERILLSEDHPVHGTYPTSRWLAGEVVTDRYAIRLDPDLPAGTYTLRLSVEGTGEEIELGTITVLQSERLFEAPPLEHEQTADFGGVVRLLGYDLGGPFRAGDAVPLRLVWQAVAPPEEGYSVFVHVVDEEGAIITQHDGIPRGDYPLYRWVAGEVVPDEVALTLPPDLAAGEYRVRVGFYRPETGERLPVLSSSGEAGADFVWLDAAIEVRR